METSSTFSIAFQVAKELVDGHLVQKIPMASIRKAVKAQLDQVLTFLILLPFQLTIFMLLLSTFGNMASRGWVIRAIGQHFLFAFLVLMAMARVFFNYMFRLSNDD